MSIEIDVVRVERSGTALYFELSCCKTRRRHRSKTEELMSLGRQSRVSLTVAIEISRDQVLGHRAYLVVDCRSELPYRCLLKLNASFLQESLCFPPAGLAILACRLIEVVNDDRAVRPAFDD